MRCLLSVVSLAFLVSLLISACAIPEASTLEPPGPCPDQEWDYQRTEILRLNPGYAYVEIIRHADFVNKFNSMPPISDRPVPDVAGYFAKLDDELAILIFASGGCVSYLEVVNFYKLQEILSNLGE